MGQRGFTLIEVLVILAIGSVLLVGAFVSVNQVVVSTRRSNSQVVVLDEVHRAALRIKKDIQAHTSADLTDLQSGNVTFSWIDNTGFAPEDERNHNSIYSLSGTELVRTFDDVPSILGRHIESLSFTGNGTYIYVVITATSSTFPPRSETLGFRVYKRTYEVVQ